MTPRGAGYRPLMGLSRFQQLTGVPAWAAGALGVALVAPLFSLPGFYSDIAWHIDFGRDKQIFTPPHTLIAVGLNLIPLAAATGVVVATRTRAAVGWRWGRLHVPWSMLPLAAFGLAALLGFPLDDLWHHAYGVDVTLWSPTHLLMVLGASLSDLALWLVVVEAGLHPRQGRGPAAVYVLLATLTLVRLSTVQAEFDFGVPQFQQLYLPVLLALAAGAGLTASRLILGRGGALLVALAFVAVRGAIALYVGPVLGHTVPSFPLYLAAAVAVEVAAAVVGTDRLIRFAAVAGLGVATLGLAGEAAWMEFLGRRPWTTAGLPAGFLTGSAAALAAAVLGAGLGGFVSRHPAGVGKAMLAGAGVVLVVALAVPFPRTEGDTEGRLAIQRQGDEARLAVEVEPAGAATGSAWFEAVAWQGGGLVKAPLERVGPGRYQTPEPVPVGGSWKTIVRLHRGTELLGLPVYLPADPAIDAAKVPARNREMAFVPDTRLLMREARGGPGWPRAVSYAGITALGAGCAAVLAVAGARVGAGSSRP